MQQDAQKKYLEPEPSVEMLAAMVNNNVRCYNESMEFAERVEETLDDDHKVRKAGLPCHEIACSLHDPFLGHCCWSAVPPTYCILHAH